MKALLLAAALAFGLALVPAGTSRAQAPSPPTGLEVIVFPGGFNWPVWAARDAGAFAREGIDLHLTATPSSVFQLTGLIDGRFDVAITAIDNLIAYDVGQGEAPTARPADLVAVMGGDNGFLHLVAVPEVRTVADLRGRTLSVDARTTGYAFVLLKLLARAGLSDADYTLVRAGGVLGRFEALLRREHAATMLISPFEVAAGARGFNDLANAADAFGHYQGLVAGVRRDWIPGHEALLRGFVRAYLAGLDWLFDPAHKADALALLRRELPTMDAAAAEKSYAVLLDPARGFARRAQIDMAGVDTVLALRREYGQPAVPLPDAARFYDPRFYDDATR